MSVENKVKEAAKGLDNLIPPKELRDHAYHQINVSMPQPYIKLELPNYTYDFIDTIAAIGLVLGIFLSGFIFSHANLFR